MATSLRPVYSNFKPPKVPITKPEMKNIVSKSKASLMSVVNNIRTIKIGITVFLIGWLGYLTYRILKPSVTNFDEQNKERWYEVHRVWFGDESIIFMLFKIWYMVLIFMALSPVLGEIIDLIRLRPF
jgi:MFS-type transporter involved in bile tolerance (Atg22 family)